MTLRLLLSLTALFCLLPPSAVAESSAEVATSCSVFPRVTTHGPQGRTMAWSVVVSGDRIVAAEAYPEGLELTETSASWRGEPCRLIAIPGGAELAPGFIEVGSRLGLVEVELESRTRHHDAGGPPVRASHRVADSYDPFATPIPVARRGGITSAVIEPSGGLISGQAAWVDLAGSSQAQAVIHPRVAFPASLGSASPGAGLDELRNLFDDGRSFARDRKAFDQNRSRNLRADRRDLEALQPVLRGEAPLVIRVDRAAHIEALIRFAEEEDIRIVLRGGSEAWKHASALAEAEIPVILDPTVYGAGSFSQREARPDGAALLAGAGVKVLFYSTYHSSHFARNLSQLGGNAVRGGMTHADAMRALTASPAAVFGMEDHGEVRAGAQANLVLWSGDPLELSSRPLLVMIGGDEQSTESRQTLLRERYRDLPQQADEDAQAD